MDFAKYLPMAFVMIAGPQILSAIFLATSESWARNSLAFIFGASLSITLFVTLAYLLGGGASDGGPSSDLVYWIVLVLLLAAMLRTYVKRGESEPPQWMAKLLQANARFSFTLGFLLLGIFPTDIITSVAVGGSLAAGHDPWTYALPFIGLTLLLLALPSLAVLVFHKRAEVFLPKARDWMTTNSWIVNEIVLLLFVGLTISNLA